MSIAFDSQYAETAVLDVSSYRGSRANLANTYSSSSTGVSVMPRGQTISWGVFQFVVGLLAAGLAALFWFYLSGITSDIKGLSQGLSDTRVELVTSVGNVEKQIAITNTKLDGILQELQHQRR